jgi:CRP-like cAMP-binding protein
VKSIDKAAVIAHCSIHDSVPTLAERQDLHGGKSQMPELEKPAFDSSSFLASAGRGRRIVILGKKQILFSQGETATSIFYLQQGRAKLTVASKHGKEATLTYLSAGEFFGEESLANAGALHCATATAITDCTALKIESEEMIRVMHEERSLLGIFTDFLLARGKRIQSDLVDQLVNSGEMRLARILLLMAGFGESDEPEKLIPEISEETLAEKLGIPLPSVKIFMNRFRERGLIGYDGRIRVKKALLDAILHDRMPGDNTATPEIAENAQRPTEPAIRVSAKTRSSHSPTLR